MKDKEKNILRAELKRYPTLNNEYGGYLTTIEQLYILERLHKPDEYDLARCQKDMESGDISSKWFYFNGNKVLKGILPIIHKNDLHKGLKK